MEDPVFDALRAAVTLARAEQIRSVARLKSRLSTFGFDQPTIDAAILFWVKHVRRTEVLA